MPFGIVAALALIAAQAPGAEGAPLSRDLSYSMPIAGDWSYAATNDGSEATFSNGSGAAQLTIRCTRATRHVSILKVASAAAPSLWIWTSSQSMSVPAIYDAPRTRVSADLAATDPLLDSIASSRGRIGFSTSGLAALVVPPWSDVARVIEDCRV